MAKAVAAALLVVACAGGSATKVDGPSTAPTSMLGRVARQCALVASCSDEHDSTAMRTPHGCVDWYLVNARDEGPLADCVMHAKDCAGLEACTHKRSDAVAESFCKSHPGTLTACESNRFVSCEGESATESTAVDCAALGGTCGERKTSGLVVRGCVSSRLCPPGSPDRRCDGDGAIIECDDGIAERSACSPSTRCIAGEGESGAPTAACRSAKGRECTMSGAAFCEGDTAYVCVQNGRFAGLHSADCASFGLGCTVRSGRVACLHATSRCNAGPARCDGEALDFCAAGEPFRVSCKELGFSGCDPAGGGGEALCATRR